MKNSAGHTGHTRSEGLLALGRLVRGGILGHGSGGFARVADECRLTLPETGICVPEWAKVKNK